MTPKPNWGRRSRLPKTASLVALQAHIFNSKNRKTLFRLFITTAIGALTAAILFFPLVSFLPSLAVAWRWVLGTGAFIGFLKSHKTISLYAVKVVTPIDACWNVLGCLPMTLTSKAGCLFWLPFLPLVLVIYLFNVPQALLRVALKTLFGNVEDLGSLYRECLWRAYLI